MSCKNSEEKNYSDLEIEGDIAKVKAELDEKYYLLGKKFCEIADKDVVKINQLVDQLVELKKKMDKQIELEKR